MEQKQKTKRPEVEKLYDFCNSLEGIGAKAIILIRANEDIFPLTNDSERPEMNDSISYLIGNQDDWTNLIKSSLVAVGENNMDIALAFVKAILDVAHEIDAHLFKSKLDDLLGI